MRHALVGLALVLVVGCGDDGGHTLPIDAAPPMIDAPPPNPAYTEVALIPATINRDLDLLFVIDDSPSMLDKQQNLKANFPNLINVLTTVQGGLPNLHLGVITTDMGSKGADDTAAGPGIGSGPGSCTMSGKDGALQKFAAPVTDAYLSDIESGVTRAKNYTGTLNDAFSAMASAGAQGCGFEQPLAAMRRSFENTTANAGFIRDAARLAIIVLTDEDDCSIAHSTLLGPDTATLGPLQSFRCTRFGVTCDVAGMTADAMNVVGTKDQCHSNEQSAYLADIARYSSFLASVKPDARDVVFAAIAGETSPFSVELRTPPGGGTAIAALAHSCTYNGANGAEVADPPARLADLATKVRSGSVDSVCNGDLSGVMYSIGQRIKTLVGDPCLDRAIALPAQCQVYDQSAAGQKFIPACDAAHTTDCFTITDDAALCPAGQQLKLDVTRTTQPSADTWTSVRCAL